MADRPFEELVAEATAHPVSGWDFSWLGDRLSTSRLPWSFATIVAEKAEQSPDLLDIDTGGGERIAALKHRPQRTVATEAWEPNVPVAKARLEPLGVEVLGVEPAPGNPAPEVSDWRLPFDDGSFHLVTNRHGSYVPREMARLLVPGGTFLTQQIDEGSYDDFYRLLGLEVPPRLTKPWNFESAVAELEAAGIKVSRHERAEERYTFTDVGAFVWYLRMVPWIVPEFSPERFDTELRKWHAKCVRGEPIVARQYRFWLEASR